MAVVVEASEGSDDAFSFGRTAEVPRRVERPRPSDLDPGRLDRGQPLRRKALRRVPDRPSPDGRRDRRHGPGRDPPRHQNLQGPEAPSASQLHPRRKQPIRPPEVDRSTNPARESLPKGGRARWVVSDSCGRKPGGYGTGGGSWGGTYASGDWRVLVGWLSWRLALPLGNRLWRRILVLNQASPGAERREERASQHHLQPLHSTERLTRPGLPPGARRRLSRPRPRVTAPERPDGRRIAKTSATKHRPAGPPADPRHHHRPSRDEITHRHGPVSWPATRVPTAGGGGEARHGLIAVLHGTAVRARRGLPPSARKDRRGKTTHSSV